MSPWMPLKWTTGKEKQQEPLVPSWRDRVGIPPLVEMGTSPARAAKQGHMVQDGASTKQNSAFAVLTLNGNAFCWSKFQNEKY